MFCYQYAGLRFRQHVWTVQLGEDSTGAKLDLI